MTERPDCKHRDACKAKTQGKHCSPCTLSAKWKDPEFREKRRKAYRAKFADPEFHAEHCARGARQLAKWRADPNNKPGANAKSLANLAIANTPENLAKRREIMREKHIGWCPKHRRDEYKALARNMPAAEARRIIEEDEQIQARRAGDTPFERQMRALQNGARLVAKPDLRKADFDFTLGGVSAGMM